MRYSCSECGSENPEPCPEINSLPLMNGIKVEKEDVNFRLCSKCGSFMGAFLKNHKKFGVEEVK